MAFIIFLCCVGVTSATAAQKPTCELKTPPHTQPVDSFYKLGVDGDPDIFIPGELYTVSLKGIDNGEGPSPFSGFTIWAERAVAHIGVETTTSASGSTPIPGEPISLGTFQTLGAQSTLYDECAPAIRNATTHSKTEVQVIWNAPVSTSDVCIRLCAKAGPNMGSDGAWSMLARRLCPAPVATGGFNKQLPIVEPCCACDEAKYEKPDLPFPKDFDALNWNLASELLYHVTFEGLWSRYTHPREFPPESARAHFGDVIGASHTAQYRVWQEGRVASPGVRRLAEDGATTALEKELKSESDHIRTIIKARGISWQHIGGAGNTASTFAVFRVDARHHLISLATKLAPSPDWIVGVSALELCNPNCTWRTSAAIPLYPFDAGTDSGISYMSRREPTVPPAAVRALRPNWPRDPRSPFFNTKGEMRAFGRLRLNRQRLYEKSCEPVDASTGSKNHQGEFKQDTGVHASGACVTTQWASWSSCSVTCGSGTMARQRHYVRPVRAKKEACREKLTDYKNCKAPRLHCRAPSEYEMDPASNSGPCAVSQWSTWSPCSGCGVRARTRHYIVHRAHKRCHIGFRARTIMHQAMPCDSGPCDKPSNPARYNDTSIDWFFVDEPTPDCSVTNWGWWSPCSHKCGRGHRLRTRLYTHRDPRARQLLNEHLEFRWNKLYAGWQGIEVKDKEFSSPDPEVQALLDKHRENCGMVLTIQQSLCEGPRCSEPSPTDVCGQPMDVGQCRYYEERWFYDTENSTCEPFGFSGCAGNDNNFKSHEECMKLCANYTASVTTSTAAPIKAKSALTDSPIKIKPPPPPPKDEPMQGDNPMEENVDCLVSSWAGWDECFGNCENSIQMNYRHVLKHAVGPDGRQCPQNLIRIRNCTLPQCHD